MKILLVGNLDVALNLPHGTGTHIFQLAKALFEQGHHVEIFTVVYPGHFPGKDREFEIFQLKNFKSDFVDTTNMELTVNCLVRKDWIVYRTFYSPMREVYEAETQKAWLDFLKKKGFWDVVHFHQVMPLSIIHMTKQMGFKVVITLHDLQHVDPNWRFFDYAKYCQNPVQDLTRDNIAPEGYVIDLLLAAGDEVSFGAVRALTREMEDRIEYGKFILSEVADVIATNLFPAGIFAHLYWNVPTKKMKAIMLNLARSNSSGATNTQGVKKPPKGRPFVIGCLGYHTPWKGQLILVEAVKYLKDLKGRFLVKFYGEPLQGMSYHNQILETIKGDSFLKEHIQLCGAYKPDQLNKICSEMHLHVVTTPIRLFCLCEGVFGETLSRGVPNLHITGEILEMYDELLGVENPGQNRFRAKIRKILEGSNMLDSNHIQHITSHRHVFKPRYETLKKIALYETGNPEALAGKIRMYIKDPDLLDLNLEGYQVPSPAKGVDEEEYIRILYS